MDGEEKKVQRSAGKPSGHNPRINTVYHNDARGNSEDWIEDDFKVNCPVCNQIPHPICFISRSGKIIATNPCFDTLLGYNTEELRNRDFTSLMGKDAGKEFKAFLGRNLQGSAGPYEVELKRKDGSRVSSIITITPYIDSNGESPGLLSSITDITAHKRLVEELSLFGVMLDTALDSIFLRELDGNTVYANYAGYRDRGYTRDEMLQTNLYQVMSPEHHRIIPEMIRNLLEKGTVTFEAEHLRKDGTSFPVEVHFSLVEYGQKKYMLSVVHDMSQRKIIEEELMRALKMESVALLAGNVASQFNTLLTHITGNLSVMMSEIEPSTQLYRLLEETDHVVDRTRNLARQLMSFSIKSTPHKKTMSVTSLVRDTADFVLSGSNTWCNYFISDDLDPVDIDESQFIHALSNIILNASEAMPRGGIINITANNVQLKDQEISNLTAGSYVKLAIQDKGQGIQPEHSGRIFDPYFTTRQGRVGLGLSVAYSVIKKHGGAITVESEQGKGSIFNIFLPASTGEIAGTASRKQITKGVKILVVDDETVIRSAGSRLLSRLGYDQVIFAGNGAEAIELYKTAFKSSPFDIAIIDLTIPGTMSGKDVVNTLREIDPNANILISSGYFNDPILSDFRRYGIKGVLAKPYQLDELELMLHESQNERVML